MPSFIDDMVYLCRRPVAYCTNPACDRVRLDGEARNGVPVDLSGVDLDWTTERFEAALRCDLCKQRGVKVKWVEYERPSVYWTEARNKAREERRRAANIIPLPGRTPA